MALYITETSDEKPSVLLVTFPSRLQTDLVGFFREKKLEVVPIELLNMLNDFEAEELKLRGRDFYKVVVFLDIRFVSFPAWPKVLSFLQKYPDITVIFPLLTPIISNDPLVHDWVSSLQIQKQLLEDLFRILPQANFLCLQDVVNLYTHSDAPLNFFLSRVGEGKLINPEVETHPQLTADVVVAVKKQLLLPIRAQRMLFQAEKRSSFAVVSEIQDLYFDKFQMRLKISTIVAHPRKMEFSFTQIVRPKSSGFAEYLKRVVMGLPEYRVEQEKVVPMEVIAPPEPAQQRPIYQPEPIQPHIPKQLPMVAPTDMPYIENRFKKYEKKMEELDRKQKFAVHWQRSMLRVKGESAREWQAAQHQPTNKKYEQEIDKEIFQLFGQQRVQQKVQRVQKKAVIKSKSKKKDFRRKIFFYLMAPLLGVGLAFVLLFFVFLISEKIVSDGVNSAVKSVVAQPITSSNQFNSLQIEGKFLAFQVDTYQFLFGDDKFIDSSILSSVATGLGEAQNTWSDLRGITTQLVSEFFGEQTGDVSTTVDHLATKSSLSYTQFSDLQNQIKNLPNSADFSAYQTGLQDKRKLLVTEEQMQQLFPTLFGFTGKKSYLVLLQNNQELRPTGGLIQAVAVVTIEKGLLVDYQVYDVDSIDRLFSGQMTPPPEVQTYLGQKNWVLRDMNWSPNYPDSAKQISTFVEKSIGRKIDGVFAMNLTGLQDILKVTGPLSLPEYNEVVNDRNVLERAEFHSEIQLVQSAKTDYFALLFNKMFSSFISLPQEKNLPLLQTLYTDLKDNQILAFIDSPDQAAILSSLGWTGEVGVPKCPSPFNEISCKVDTMFQVESNVGVNKANFALQRSIQQTISFANNQITHQRVVTFTNTAATAAWPMGEYKSYIRFYVPEEAQLQEIRLDSDVVPADNITVGTEDGRKYFGVLVEVPIQQTKKLYLTYTEPLGENTPFSYVFFEQKQSGTVADPLVIDIQPGEGLHPVLIAPQADANPSRIHFDIPREKNTFVGVKFQ